MSDKKYWVVGDWEKQKMLIFKAQGDSQSELVVTYPTKFLTFYTLDEAQKIRDCAVREIHLRSIVRGELEILTMLRNIRVVPLSDFRGQ